MKIYLSGLIAAGGTLPFEQVTKNCEVFDRHAARLRAAGHEVYNPAEDDDPRERPDTVSSLDVHHECLRRDLRHLLDCDAIYMIPGWQRSVGAPVELYLARAVGMTLLGRLPSQTAAMITVEPEVIAGAAR